MISHKQLGFCKVFFPAYKNVNSEVRAPERPVLVAAMESREARAARRLRPDKKSSSLLLEQVSRLSQPGQLIVVLFVKLFLKAVDRFMLLRHRVFLGGETDLECFRVAKAAAGRQFAEAAYSAGTVVELSREEAELPSGWLLSCWRWRLRTRFGLRWRDCRCTNA